MSADGFNYEVQSMLESLEAALETLLMGRPAPPIAPMTDRPQANRVIELVNMLSGNLTEMAQFARELGRGSLSVETPGRRNYLASPLKELHSQLSAFTWTAQQLREGNVVEASDYMGELSQALNGLIERASEQGGLLFQQRKGGMTNAQYRQMLNTLNHLPFLIIVADSRREVLFANTPAIRSFGKIKQLKEDGEPLETVLFTHNEEENTFPFYTEVWDERAGKWYKVATDLLSTAKGEQVFLHYVEDISEWKLNEKQLVRSATLDPLTGVLNRAMGIKALEVALNNRDCTTSCMAFADVDGLKSVNDNFGHNEGDYVISTIADAFSSSLRDTDTVSRFGGDEFLLVFTGCQIDIAEKVIGRVQEKIAQINATNGKPFTLSFSHGITQIDKETDLSVKQIIQLSDKKMYERKRAKR